MRELMKTVVDDFERGDDWSPYRTVVQRMSVSRIMLDTIIADATAQGLITQDSDGDLHLATKGKLYAIQHKLIETWGVWWC